MIAVMRNSDARLGRRLNDGLAFDGGDLLAVDSKFYWIHESENFSLSLVEHWSDTNGGNASLNICYRAASVDNVLLKFVPIFFYEGRRRHRRGIAKRTD